MSAEKKTSEIFKFAALVCLVCSLVVSIAAVSLRGIQEKNALNEKRINILRAAGLVKSDEHPNAQKIEDDFHKIYSVVVDLDTGELDTSKDPATYDMYEAAQSSSEGHALTNDPASIKRIATDGSAYILVKDNQIDRLILPVQGYGLWSTMYGFTALSFKDKKITIADLTFYKHGETPGLGALITDPRWQAGWKGLQPYSAKGVPQVVVAKRANPKNKNEVDGISGATLTSNGVQHLMNFWLGKQGYEKFIDNVRSGKITVEQIKAAQSPQGNATQESAQ